MHPFWRLVVLVNLLLLWGTPLYAQECPHVQRYVPLRGDLSALPPPGIRQRYDALVVYGMASLARASLVLEQLEGTRWLEVNRHLPFMSDLFLFTEDVAASAIYLRGEESLYFLCVSRGPDATVVRAAALCQRLTEAYLGPDF